MRLQYCDTGAYENEVNDDVVLHHPALRTAVCT